jgi:hypothetical protein
VHLSSGPHSWHTVRSTCLVTLRLQHVRSQTSALEPLARTGAATYIAQRRAAPSLVVLSTGFSPLWTLSGGKSTHLMVNGYANGWLYLPQEVGPRVEVMCRSVVLLRLGIVISVLGLLVTATLLFTARGNTVHAKG